MTKPNITVNVKQFDGPVSKDRGYEVIKVTNSTRPEIGADLSEFEVKDLIIRGVTVNITGS
tara:strand:+ start:294 stop:476 length:183 start_codon:yes stop_codon:yes gene_type:complete